MIIKEQIRAEIERRKNTAETMRERGAYIGLLDYLDILPEQPVIKKSNALFDECVKNCDPAVMKEVSDNIDKMLGRQPVEGLEEEVKRYYADNFDYISSEQPTLSILTNIARHFAEWGAEHLRDTTKMIDEGLEEAAEKSASQYYVDGGYSPFPNVETAAHKAGFIAGAEWQKKLDDLETADLLAIAHLQGMEQQKAKMLEEAVEGEVTTDNRGNNVVRAGVFNKDFEYGDKVRIIIVKEDEK